MADKKHRGGKAEEKLDDSILASGRLSSSTPSTKSRPKSPRSRFTAEYEAMLDLLIAARKQAGITQKEVAEHLGKTQSHVSMAEAKEREFSFVDIFRFCAAINIEFSHFARMVEDEIRRKNIKTP